MTAPKTTPAYIGGGTAVHALAGEFTAEGLSGQRGPGIGVDTICGARRRVGSRSMFLPTITLVTDGSPVSCSRCIAGARRRRSAVTPVVETIDERAAFDAAEVERLQRAADEQTAVEFAAALEADTGVSVDGVPIEQPVDERNCAQCGSRKGSPRHAPLGHPFVAPAVASAPLVALRKAVDAAIAGGSPVLVEQPVVRIVIDADCPACGKPERSFDPARGVFACSSLGGGPCGYESTERDA
jgi:hypothetical protein